METDAPKVDTLVANPPRIFTNTVSIYLKELIQDETRMVRILRSDYISLEPSSGFTPHHLSRLLREEQVLESQYLGQKLAVDINHSLTSDDSPREPVFVYAHVHFIREARLIFPPDAPTPSRGTPREVFQRLTEEHRVESMGLEVKNETQCSICIDICLRVVKTSLRCLGVCICSIKIVSSSGSVGKIVSSSGSVGETRALCAGVFRTSWIKKQRLRRDL